VSRVGKLPIPLPDGVTCEVKGSHVKVKGPKGELENDFRPEVDIALNDNEITVTRRSDKPDHRAVHGLTRALINNMVVGVTQGFERELNLVGVGYRAALQGNTLALQVGYSHPVNVEPPEGVTFTLDGNTTIKINGIDKQVVGQTAAKIRALRKPEPYKGKGIRYADEQVRRKAGKAAGK